MEDVPWLNCIQCAQALPGLDIMLDITAERDEYFLGRINVKVTQAKRVVQVQARPESFLATQKMDSILISRVAHAG